MATASSSHAARKRLKRRLCGVPSSECCGAVTRRSPALPDGLKSHATPEEAFACYRSWLLRQGYEQAGSREFLAPEGTIVVLTKKRRFGAVLRGGKEERFMPALYLSGTIVG